MSESISNIPMPMRRIVETLRRNVYDSAERTGESGDVVFRSCDRQLHVPASRRRAVRRGADRRDVRCGCAELEDDAVDFVNENCASRPGKSTRPIGLCPRRCREDGRVAAERAHLVVGFLGLEKATESQLDDLASLIAPYVLFLLGIVRSRIDDAEQFIGGLGLPPGSWCRRFRPRHCRPRRGGRRRRPSRSCRLAGASTRRTARWSGSRGHWM